MPRALAPAIRRAILNRARHHQSPGEIAQEMELEERTVRRIVTGFQEQGETALQAAYGACGVSRTVEFAQLRQQILELRQQHPLWGAGRLLLELELSQPNAVVLPTERTLQRWLREVYPTPAPAGRPAQDSWSRASRPHEVWQVDASEQKHLGSGKMFSWLRVVDECSGAVLKTVVFSRRTFSTGSSPSSPAGIPQDFPAVGLPRHDACGQWRAVGFVQRSASATGSVDHRTGGPDALERPLLPPAKRGRGTQSRTGCPLGRTETTSDRVRIPTANRSRRLSATRTASSDRGPDAMECILRVEIGRTDLQLSLGTNPLGLGPSPSALEPICCHSASRLLGKNRALRQQVVCRHNSQRVDRLYPVQPRRSGLAHHRYARPAVARDSRSTDSRRCSNSDRTHPFNVTLNGQTFCRYCFLGAPPGAARIHTAAQYFGQTFCR